MFTLKITVAISPDCVYCSSFLSAIPWIIPVSNQQNHNSDYFDIWLHKYAYEDFSTSHTGIFNLIHVLTAYDHCFQQFIYASFHFHVLVS